MKNKGIKNRELGVFAIVLGVALGILLFIPNTVEITYITDTSPINGGYSISYFASYFGSAFHESIKSGVCQNFVHTVMFVLARFGALLLLAVSISLVVIGILLVIGKLKNSRFVNTFILVTGIVTLIVGLVVTLPQYIETLETAKIYYFNGSHLVTESIIVFGAVIIALAWLTYKFKPSTVINIENYHEAKKVLPHVFCMACGGKNEGESLTCVHCGYKLPKQE